MITLAAAAARVRGLDVATVEIWIRQDWIRPLRPAGEPMLEEVDVARLRLILELRDELEVGESAMPVVLSLLDELHATRRDLRRLAEALRERG